MYISNPKGTCFRIMYVIKTKTFPYFNSGSNTIDVTLRSSGLDILCRRNLMMRVYVRTWRIPYSHNVFHMSYWFWRGCGLMTSTINLVSLALFIFIKLARVWLVFTIWLFKRFEKLSRGLSRNDEFHCLQNLLRWDPSGFFFWRFSVDFNVPSADDRPAAGYDECHGSCLKLPRFI